MIRRNRLGPDFYIYDDVVKDAYSVLKPAQRLK